MINPNDLKRGDVLRALKDYNFDDGFFVVSKGEEFEIEVDGVGCMFFMKDSKKTSISYFFKEFFLAPLFGVYIRDEVFEKVGAPSVES